MKDKFADWFNENKESDSLIESYENYKMDNRYTGEKPLTFRQWAEGVFMTEECV